MHEDLRTHSTKEARTGEFGELQTAPASVASYFPHAALGPVQLAAFPQATAPGHADAYVAIAELHTEFTQERHVDCADVGFWHEMTSLAPELAVEHAGAMLNVRPTPMNVRSREDATVMRVLASGESLAASPASLAEAAR
jgi:hypothetical protein